MRGLEVRALSGFSTGQKPYGYYSEPTKITLMKGVEKPSHFEIRVEQIQAEVIRRIWKLFSECMGCKAIAKKLNDESVLPPTKKSKRWREKMIWNILNQSKYIGLWKYRQTKVVKNPETERLTQQDRPKKEWIVAEREELRIIPRELEEKVIVRKKEIADERFQGTTPEQRRFSNTGRLPSHILIGTMSCGICGGNFFLASGKSGGYLGCMNASRQAGAECANKQMIKMSLVEWNIVDELKKNLEDSRTYDYLARRYNELMGKRSSDVPHRLNEVEITISKQEKVIANYTKFIGEGVWSDTIATELTATEHKVKELKKERDYLKERLGERLYVTPHAIRERLLNLNEVLGQRVSEANRIMRRLFPEKITMKPTVVKGKKSYEASGVLNLYAVTRFSSVVNGVPNEIRTRVLTVKG
ncbi:MAG: hypothetical protein EXR74_02260 [Bdellovibrionales bacterium]|nr:hypothetical protein [Bdellovibrionales bacterium]